MAWPGRRLTTERAAKHARHWWMQILEGLTNIGVAGWVLLWSAIAAVAFFHVLSIWANVTGRCCSRLAQAQPDAWPLDACLRRRAKLERGAAIRIGCRRPRQIC
jgi:hypothetical protein